MKAPSIPARQSVVTIVSLGLLIVAVVGLGSSNWILCDLLANLRIHTIVAMFFMMPVQIHFKRRSLMLVTATVVIINLGTLIVQPSAAGRQESASRETLTIVSFNLGPRGNGQPATRRFLGEAKADIIILQEYNHTWHEYLRTLSATYPYSVTEPRDGSFGIALFSRYPFVEPVVQEFADSGIPFVQVTALLADQEIDVLGIHLQWPGTPTSFSERSRQIQSIIAMANARRRLVACGDWNLTPWSGWYRRLTDAGLHDGNYPYRLYPTWPDPLRWLGIPIDHCLVSTDLAILNKQIEASLGSDHRPISVTIGLGQNEDSGI